MLTDRKRQIRIHPITKNLLCFLALLKCTDRQSHQTRTFIRNHFDRADFVNLSSEIDFDLKYSDSAFINKSNGMITESHSYFSEELNFGEPIHSNSSSDVRSLKVAMKSLVTIIELPNYFEQAESERVKSTFSQTSLFLSLRALFLLKKLEKCKQAKRFLI